MATTERITVTLPARLVGEIDRPEKNRSKFVAEAVYRELDRRRREELRRSLQRAHPETEELADAGLAAWRAAYPRKTSKHWSTWMPARRSVGSQARAGAG
jgi:Arc/MetJ-type ribon-helix-helix transcriptional regulator